MPKFKVFMENVEHEWSMAYEAIERTQGQNIAEGKLVLHPGDRYVWMLVCIDGNKGIVTRPTFSGEWGNEVVKSFLLDELIDYDTYKNMLNWIHFCCLG